MAVEAVPALNHRRRADAGIDPMGPLRTRAGGYAHHTFVISLIIAAATARNVIQLLVAQLVLAGVQLGKVFLPLFIADLDVVLLR